MGVALWTTPALAQDAPATDTGVPEATDTAAPAAATDTAAPPAATDTAAPPAATDTAAPAAATDTGTPPAATDTGAPPAAADTAAPAAATDTGAPPAATDTGAPPAEDRDAVEPIDPGAPAVDDPGAVLVPKVVVPMPAPAPVPPRPIGPLPAVPFAPRAADAAEGTPSVEDDEPGIEKYRAPFSVIADRAIGTTSTPVEFDWRRTKVQVGAYGSFLSELNNFNSLRGGGIGRFPSKGVIWEVGLSYVSVRDTAATRDLALTPYRQAGRPKHGELDVGVAVPLAEGVVTTVPSWFPAVQMVLNGYVDLRYRVYPSGYRGLTFGQVAGTILNPQLTPEERNNLEGSRLEAMTVDRERFGFLMGIGNDFYFKPGLFVSPRILFSVPLMAPISETQLVWWSDAQLAVGVAF